MSEKSSSSPPQSKPSSRSRAAVVLLLLIVGFAGYGVFERSRLLAAQQREQEAIKYFTESNGATIEADSKDWRILFVPDQPDAAKRVGTVTIAHQGVGPEYTQKVVEQLGAFDYCGEVFISNGPLEKVGRDGRPAPQKGPKIDPSKLETLNVKVVREKFPKLVIHDPADAPKAEKAATAEPAHGEGRENPHGDQSSKDETNEKPSEAKEKAEAGKKPASQEADPKKEEEPKKEEPAKSPEATEKKDP